jgi:hypothetical protein
MAATTNSNKVQHDRMCLMGENNPIKDVQQSCGCMAPCCWQPTGTFGSNLTGRCICPACRPNHPYPAKRI